ncbi:50S ribosomal protein L19 [bacterium]|nr:50S ribosomal protein L19 [bacterium]|tara:strand:- start:107 stop:646 length:540 start_codon:yes stop_codon:yes gene_type:complete
MNQALINSVSKSNLKAVPQIKVGQLVKVYQKIKEGEKTRTQVFQGLVIKMKGEKGINQTFTVRNIVSGVGVEKIFPVHSDNIEKVEIIRQNKIRRAKLYYMRERTGKSARLKGVSDDFEALNQINDIESIYKDLPETHLAKEEAPAEEAKAASTEETSEEKASEAPTEEAKATEKEEEK